MSKKQKKEKKNKIRCTRKMYIPFYIMVLIILVFIAFIKLNGREINSIALVLMIVFIVLIFKITEVHRLNNYYELGDKSIIHSSGIIGKTIKRMDYFGISDIKVNQSVFQRVFNYGNILINLFGETNLIKNIDNPDDFANKIEEKMFKKRKSV